MNKFLMSLWTIVMSSLMIERRYEDQYFERILLFRLLKPENLTTQVKWNDTDLIRVFLVMPSSKIFDYGLGLNDSGIHSYFLFDFMTSDILTPFVALYIRGCMPWSA
jgi:hypothetical protein